MRWKKVVVGLALWGTGVAGCKQQCFIHECDYDHYRQLIPGMPANLECDPQASVVPTSKGVPAPTTIFDVERPIRYMSLIEAIAIALEQGNVGITDQRALGFAIDTPNAPGTRGGAFDFPADSNRVLALGPARQAAAVDFALAKFDAEWTTSVTWNTEDRPVGSPLDVFQTQGRQINGIQNSNVNATTALIKPLPTGGLAGITFGSVSQNFYQFTNLPARVNPAYRPELQFAFEQPLLQFFGVEINQLRETFPSGVGPLRGSPTSAQSPGGAILLQRIAFDQSRADFERNVNFKLVNVETAYWNFYAAYWDLYGLEQALRHSFEAWKITRDRYNAGLEGYDIAVFAQSRQQYESFRAQRTQALGRVLESERQLRGLLGMPVEDGWRLVPSDSPTLAPYCPNWDVAVNEALNLRPELVSSRLRLREQQLNLLVQKNNLLPDLRFFSAYSLNGLGSRLDGSSADNAFRSLVDNDFHNWETGLRLFVPIGFRRAHADVRRARIELAQAYGNLRNQEDRALRFLTHEYRRIFESYELIKMQRAQREAAATQLEARTAQYRAGRKTLDVLLESQRVWAEALREEFRAVAEYNSALAAFEFAKGTIMQHDNVYIAEGSLPECAQVRAVEHERERTKALVLVKRADPTGAAHPDDGVHGVLQVPTDAAPALPGMLEQQPLQNWEALPAPRLGDQARMNTTPSAMPPSLPRTPAPAEPARLPAMAPTTTRTIAEPPSLLENVRQRMFSPSPATKAAPATGTSP